MTKPTTLAWMTCALLALHTGAHAQTQAWPRQWPRPMARTMSQPRPADRDHAYVLMGSPSASGVGAAVRWPVGARLGVELGPS